MPSGADLTVWVARPADAPAIARVYAPAVIGSAISFEYEPPGADEMLRRVDETLPEHPWLVAADQDAVVGYAYAHAFSGRAAYRWSAETSVYIEPAHHRAGVGRRLYTALLAVLALQGYRQAFAGIALPNPGSVGLHETMGFVRVGTYAHVGWKLGAWHDVGWWQRPIGAAGADAPASSAPVPLTALGPAALAAALEGR